MDISPEATRVRLERMNDEELLALYRSGDLTAAALALEEIARRGLEAGASGSAATAPAGSGYDDRRSTVTAFHTTTEAHIFKSSLESLGVPALVAEANFLQAEWHLSIGAGGVRVMVAAHDLARARSIYEDYIADRLQLDDDDEEAETLTPAPAGNPYDMAVLIRDYVASFPQYYEPKIAKLLAGKLLLGFNTTAAFFFPLWAAARKLYWLAAVVICLESGSLVMARSQITDGVIEPTLAAPLFLGVLVAERVVLGGFANFIYLRKARAVVRRAQQRLGERPELKQVLGYAGGTNGFAVAVAAIASLAVTVVIDRLTQP